VVTFFLFASSGILLDRSPCSFQVSSLPVLPECNMYEMHNESHCAHFAFPHGIIRHIAFSNWNMKENHHLTSLLAIWTNVWTESYNQEPVSYPYGTTTEHAFTDAAEDVISRENATSNKQSWHAGGSLGSACCCPSNTMMLHNLWLSDANCGGSLSRPKRDSKQNDLLLSAWSIFENMHQ
jgi:hypothetical protein